MIEMLLLLPQLPPPQQLPLQLQPQLQQLQDSDKSTSTTKRTKRKSSRGRRTRRPRETRKRRKRRWRWRLRMPWRLRLRLLSSKSLYLSRLSKIPLLKLLLMLNKYLEWFFLPKTWPRLAMKSPNYYMNNSFYLIHRTDIIMSLCILYKKIKYRTYQ